MSLSIFKKIPSFLWLFVVFSTVVFFGFQQQWFQPLVGDPKYYYSISSYFFAHQSLVNFKETLLYPPGANLFFLILPSSGPFNNYLVSLFVANLIFILTLAKLYGRNILLFGLLILFTGPLIIFRFDLLVVILTILALKSLQKTKFVKAGLWLGIAAATKIFPIILLPYFVIVLWQKKQKLMPVIKMLTMFFLGASGVVITYALITQQNLFDIWTGFYFNFSKSVHVESVVGSVLILISQLKHTFPQPITFTNGVWALTPYYFLGHLRIFSYIQMLGVILIYGVILWTRKTISNLNLSLCILIILTLLVTSQVISPQYLIWPFFLVPLLSPKELLTWFWKINIVLICFCLLLTQYVYPLNYDTFIFDVFGQGRNLQIFWALAIRNLILIILAGRLCLALLRSNFQKQS